MKKIFISYYAIVILVILIIRNILLANLIISGLLYNGFMLIFIILNYIIINKYKNVIKWKTGIIIFSFFLLIFSQDIFQLLFILSNMIILMGKGYFESRLLKIPTIIFLSLSLILLLLILSCPFILLIFIYSLFLNMNGNDIYEDMHYYCENNIEIYAYSQGAMDSYHYSVGKYYEFLEIDDIIYISYHERNEVKMTYLEYEAYLRNHSCKLVGEQNEYK